MNKQLVKGKGVNEQLVKNRVNKKYNDFNH